MHISGTLAAARNRPNEAFRAGSGSGYTVVNRDTSEQQFAACRQRFLTEQGYDIIIDAERVLTRE